MAGSHRTSTKALAVRQALAEQPERFDFFQALRWLEAQHSELPRIGKALRAAEEPVLFGQVPDLAFPTSMLARFAEGADGHRARLDVKCFGLFGPNGALPLHLSEYAYGRDRHEHDSAMRRFVDVFHHRMISLFYRAWADAQPTVSYDRPDEDRFGQYVASLIGMGLPGLQDCDALPDHSRLYLAGLLAMQQRPAGGLGAVLEEFLQVPVTIEEFVGEWAPLPDDARSALGVASSSGRLGVDVTAGEQVWFCQGRVRIHCGPLSFARFRSLLPDAASLPPLTALVRSYAGQETAWQLHLVLRADEVPRTCLGVSGQLGWTSWLGERQTAADATDVLIDPDTVAGRRTEPEAAVASS